MALRFFSIIDATSLNIRRMITFSTYCAANGLGAKSVYSLVPLQYTSMTRYDAIKLSTSPEGDVDALEKWHLGYKLLAESHIRRRL